MVLKRISKSKVMVVSIFPELPCSISNSLIYRGPQSYIWVKIYGRLNWPGDSMFNFERLDTLWYSREHPSQKLWSFNYVKSFRVQFRASWYNMDLNRTSESKVMAVSIFLKLLCSIMSVLICHGPQSYIWVTSKGRLDSPVDSMFNYEHLDIYGS